MKRIIMLKNIIYAVLLGVGMAACLSQNEDKETPTDTETATEQPATAGETTPANPDSAEFILAKGQAGSIKKGMLITDMRRDVPQGFTVTDTTIMLEGNPATAYVLRPKGSNKGILIEQACEPECKVWRISVHHPSYKTASGIGIGSKYGEVQANYPIKYVSLAEGNFVAVSEEAGLSFILDKGRLPESKLPDMEAKDVPANTLVTGILIY